MRNTRSAKRARIATTGTSNAATGTTQSSQSNIHACNDTNDEPEPTQPLEKGADTHKDARVMLLQPIEKDGDTLNSKHSKHTANKVRNALARGTKRGSSTRDGTEKGVHSSKNQAVTRNSDVQNSLTTVQMDVMIPHDILVLIIQHCDEKELLELRRVSHSVNNLVQYHRRQWRFNKRVVASQGLQSIARIAPRLTALTMRKCMNLTDNNLKLLLPLIGLKELDISGCRGLFSLCMIPDGVAANLEVLNIDGLNLWQNKERQPNEMERFVQLVSLRLSASIIQTGGPEMLKGLTSLRHLDVNIEGSEYSVSFMANSVMKSSLHSRLERLVIRQSALRSMPQWAFLSQMQRLRELHFLDSLSYVMNESEGSILSHVDKISSLQQLSIHVFYKLSMQGLTTTFLPKSAANITNLSLSLLDSVDPILPFLPMFIKLSALKVVMFSTMTTEALAALKERIQHALPLSADMCRVQMGSVEQDQDDDDEDSDFSIGDRSSDDEDNAAYGL